MDITKGLRVSYANRRRKGFLRNTKRVLWKSRSNYIA